MKKFRIPVIILSLMCIAVLAVLIVFYFMPDDSDTITLTKIESYAVITEKPFMGASGHTLLIVHDDSGADYRFTIDKTEIYDENGKRVKADALEDNMRIKFIFDGLVLSQIIYDQYGNQQPQSLCNCYEIHIINE